MMTSSSLIIHVYAVCWNEEVILPHFLSHYAYAEKIFIYDNGSTDRSLEIMAKDPRVSVEHFETGNYIDDPAIEKIKNEAWKNSRGIADYVIACDMDEFLYHPNMMQALKHIKSLGVSILKPRGYNMVGDRVPRLDEDIKAVITGGFRGYKYDKCILFDPNKLDEINFSIGCHACEPVGEIKYYRDPGWLLLHYKYLSEEYIINRTRILGTRRSDSDRIKHSAYKIPLWMFKNRPELVFEQSEISFKHNVSDLEAIYQKALQYLRQRDYLQARKHLEEILVYQPDHAEALGNLGLVLARMGLKNEGQWCMRQALTVDKNNYEIWYNLGNLFYRAKEMGAARDCYAHVMKLAPDFKQAFQQYNLCQNN